METKLLLVFSKPIFPGFACIKLSENSSKYFDICLLKCAQSSSNGLNTLFPKKLLLSSALSKTLCGSKKAISSSFAIADSPEFKSLDIPNNSLLGVPEPITNEI